jgi:hypothetical protein
VRILRRAAHDEYVDEMAMHEATARELARRTNDDVEVTLLWSPADDRLTVVVEDAKLNERFELDTRPDNALEVFHHPYAYAPVWVSAAAALAA